MLSKVYSCMVLGVEGITLDIEVDITNGLPVFSTVGLADGAVKESKDRVRAAIKNSGYEFPNKRITVNLAPANLKKIGAGYDLPIALGILSANGLISYDKLSDYSIIGELSLDGSVRSINGILPMVIHARANGKKGIILPFDNRQEGNAVEDIEVIPVSHLHHAVDFFTDGSTPDMLIDDSYDQNVESKYTGDYSDVRGQEFAKRALEIAAAGSHNILLKGPPGAGKTMMAKRLITILPELDLEEALETTKIHSIAGKLTSTSKLISQKPFRAPHHTTSNAGLVGGGTIPKPGEISLSHNGILFLDEITEFNKSVLEMLRQPLEDGTITISRANMSLTFPADFILVGAYNPCPCGFHGSKRNQCNCNSAQIQKYMSKLSGPLLDRFDLHIEVASLEYEDMQYTPSVRFCSQKMKENVIVAKNLQKSRYESVSEIQSNAMMGAAKIDEYCILDKKSKDLLKRAVDKLGLSARGYHKTLKVARTIADIDGSENIMKHHISEAIQYRMMI